MKTGDIEQFKSEITLAHLKNEIKNAHDNICIISNPHQQVDYLNFIESLTKDLKSKVKINQSNLDELRRKQEKSDFIMKYNFMVDYNMCLESYPCQHHVSLYINGIFVKKVTMGARKIISLHKENGLQIPSHFEEYDKPRSQKCDFDEDDYE